MGRRKLFEWGALTVTLVLAAILRLHGLGQQSFWNDETATRLTAVDPDLRLFDFQAPGENTPPPYFFVIRGWMKVFGSSDASVRMPSALFGIGAVAIMFLLGRKIAPEGSHRFHVGLFAALLLTMSRFHIAYSQEARSYSMAFFLGVVSCYAFVALLRTRSVALRWLYVLSTSAMFWIHPTTLPLFGLQVVYLGIVLPLGKDRDNGISLRHWCTLIGAIVLTLWPWITMAQFLAGGGQRWMPKPVVSDIFREFLGNHAACAIFIVLFLCAAVYAIKQATTAPVFTLLVAIAPIAVPVLLSQGYHSYYVSRYAIVALIGICISAGFGAMLFGRVLGCAIVLSLCLTASPQLCSDFRAGINLQNKADIRGTIRQIESLHTPGDAVWCPWDLMATTAQDYLTASSIPMIQSLDEDDGRGPLPPNTVWLILNRTSDSPEFEKMMALKYVANHPYHLERLWMGNGTVLVKLTRGSTPTSKPSTHASN